MLGGSLSRSQRGGLLEAGSAEAGGRRRRAAGCCCAAALLDSLSACKKESRARISDAPRTDSYCLVFPNFCKKPK